MTPKFGKSVSIAFSSSFENLNIIEKVLSTIRQKDIHIIVAFFEEEDASKILCKVSGDSKCTIVGSRSAGHNEFQWVSKYFGYLRISLSENEMF